MAKFKKGDKVNFERNSAIKKKNTSIIAVMTLLEDREQTYIIEHNEGWVPNEIRIKQFELKENKKYLFVQENELTSI